MMRSMACILPGMKGPSSAASSASRTRVVDDDDEDGEYDLFFLQQQQSNSATQPYQQQQQQQQQHFASSWSQPGLANASSDSSSTTTWADVTFALEGLDMNMGSTTAGDQSTVISHLSGSGSMSMSSPPISPRPTSYNNNSSNGNGFTSPPNCSPIPVPGTSSSTCGASTTASTSTSTTTTATTTTPRRRRRPLTTPLPRSSPRRTSSPQPPHAQPQPERCPKVMDTMALLKRIKQQIKALKRRESQLGTNLQIQRRERQPMRDQIAYLEGRRLRVEALFLRPLPLVLLLPVVGEDEYDLCLVSEGNDEWNALEPLMRIRLVQPEQDNSNDNNNISSSRMGALLVHFGPTQTQSMAAALSFVEDYVDRDAIRHSRVDLQQTIKHHDLPFWERVTSLEVVSTTSNTNTAQPELETTSCHFLFDALMEHKELWRHTLTHVVDKKTRHIQWVLQQEVDPLYYEPIPAH